MEKNKIDEINSKTVEVEKIYCPSDGVVFIKYDKRYRPVISVFGGS